MPPVLGRSEEMKLRVDDPGGFEASSNPSFRVDGQDEFWTSRYHCGLDQGPIVPMIENHRTGLLCGLTRNRLHLVAGPREPRASTHSP